MNAGGIMWTRTLGTVALVFIGAIPASAQVQYESAKLTADDAVRDGRFGGLVAISGDVAIIGALGNGEAGFHSGAAYVFRRNGSEWLQEQKLLASDPLDGDRFGRGVAIRGNTVMVTASQSDTVTGNDGAVYVFVWDETQWVERQKLLAFDPVLGGQFGISVAVDGDVAAIGQIGDDFAGASSSGAVYVFRWNGTSWVHEQKLQPPDLGPFDGLGASVAVSGNLIVGGTLGSSARAAYVFRWNGTTWVQEAMLTAGNLGSGEGFGLSMGIEGNELVVGAPQEDEPFLDCGAAYTYRFNGTQWILSQRLTSPNAVQYGSFGNSVAHKANHFIVGAYLEVQGAIRPGATYLYQLQSEKWVLAKQLIASDAETGDTFGHSVSLTQNHALVGASGSDDACPNDPFCVSGSAYIYLLADCNGNGIADESDIASGNSADCNGNGVPDECEAPCTPVIGACCNLDAFEACTDGLTASECNCERCEWTESATCDEVECLRESIPTISAWGVAILTLLLIIGAKIRFGPNVQSSFSARF